MRAGATQQAANDDRFSCGAVQIFKLLLKVFCGLTLVLVQGSQELHWDQRLQTQFTAGGSGSSRPLE